MRILVTGATSNLGAEVAVSLGTRGHQIRGLALLGLPRGRSRRSGEPMSMSSSAFIADSLARLRLAIEEVTARR